MLGKNTLLGGRAAAGFRHHLRAVDLDGALRDPDFIGNDLARDDRWSPAIAVGGKSRLSTMCRSRWESWRRIGRSAERTGHIAREPARDYEAISDRESGLPRQDNTLPWK